MFVRLKTGEIINTAQILLIVPHAPSGYPRMIASLAFSGHPATPELDADDLANILQAIEKDHGLM